MGIVPEGEDTIELRDQTYSSVAAGEEGNITNQRSEIGFEIWEEGTCYLRSVETEIMVARKGRFSKRARNEIERYKVEGRVPPRRRKLAHR